MCTHVFFKLKNGAKLMPCHAARKNTEGARWVRPAEFETLPEHWKCKHCIKILAKWKAKKEGVTDNQKKLNKQLDEEIEREMK